MDEEKDDTSHITQHASDQAESDHVMRDARCGKCEEYLSGWKRAQADYQNLKKEVQRERDEYVKFANERFLRDLLPAFDQYDLAMRHTPDPTSFRDEERKRFENWLQGLRAVQSIWDQVANGLELERITGDGMFDPTEQEALAEEAVEGAEAGSIVRVVEHGWRWHGKVLRPAKVIIAK